MTEHAIPSGTRMQTHRWVILPLLCFAMALGCAKKPITTGTGPAGTGPVANQGAAPGDGASGRNTILQMPFDNVAKLVLLNIGKAYQMASIANGKPPKDAVELDAGVMKTKRDMQDHEVVVLYGVDPKRLQGEPSDFMIAWEKEPTNDGYRMVMMADFQTIKYVSQAEFDKMKKAK